MKINFKKSNGITLIALVITIIVLLILAGISISALNGENGLFSKVKQGKEKYSIAQAKEKIELEITNLQIEKQEKGEELKKEDLPKMDSDEIDVRDTTNFPVEIICNGYKFNIDSGFNVSYVGIANETIITYTTEPEGYTNQDSVKVTVKITSPKGIKSILKPGETDKILPQNRNETGIDFTVTKNGHYILKVEDIDGNEILKDIVINQIDRLPPKEFEVSAEERDGKLIIVADAEDEDETEESTKSGIEKYEYYVNGTKYEKNEIEGITLNDVGSLYVKVYDRAGNSRTVNRKWLLYNKGNRFENITGGWTKTTQSYSSFREDINNAICANRTALNYGAWAISTNKAIDITKYKKLCCQYTASEKKYNDGLRLRLNDSLYTSTTGADSVATHSSNCFEYAKTDEIFEWDISQISKKAYYIGIGGSGAAETWIYQIWLE